MVDNDSIGDVAKAGSSYISMSKSNQPVAISELELFVALSLKMSSQPEGGTQPVSNLWSCATLEDGLKHVTDDVELSTMDGKTEEELMRELQECHMFDFNQFNPAGVATLSIVLQSCLTSLS